MGYAKPVVIIDLDEYNDLKRIEKDNKEHAGRIPFNEIIHVILEMIRDYGTLSNLETDTFILNIDYSKEQYVYNVRLK